MVNAVLCVFAVVLHTRIQILRSLPSEVDAVKKGSIPNAILQLSQNLWILGKLVQLAPALAAHTDASHLNSITSRIREFQFVNC